MGGRPRTHGSRYMFGRSRVTILVLFKRDDNSAPPRGLRPRLESGRRRQSLSRVPQGQTFSTPKCLKIEVESPWTTVGCVQLGRTTCAARAHGSAPDIARQRSGTCPRCAAQIRARHLSQCTRPRGARCCEWDDVACWGGSAWTWPCEFWKWTWPEGSATVASVLPQSTRQRQCVHTDGLTR